VEVVQDRLEKKDALKKISELEKIGALEKINVPKKINLAKNKLYTFYLQSYKKYIYNMNMDSSRDVTKKVCLCSFTSIVIIILFIISPLSTFVLTSSFMKIIVLIILGYTIYLNNYQTNILSLSNNASQTPEVQAQLSTNIICSYVFTLFLGILFIFVIKSFF
jgi:hypothetical protein